MLKIKGDLGGQVVNKINIYITFMSNGIMTNKILMILKHIKIHRNIDFGEEFFPNHDQVRIDQMIIIFFQNVSHRKTKQIYQILSSQ